MHDESNKQPCCNPPWEPPQVIPAQVRRVNNLIFRKINQFHRENNVDNVTPMHDWIMSYLYWHKNDPVYQRDIEREFSITRSTVTNILQLMERKGYIERQSVPQDARQINFRRITTDDQKTCVTSGRVQARRDPDTDLLCSGSHHGCDAAYHHGLYH